MLKKTLIIALSLILILSLTIPSSAQVTGNALPYEEDGIILLPNTDPNGISLLDTELLPPTFNIAAHDYKFVGAQGYADRYFTSVPGTNCMFTFYANTPGISVQRVTIGGYSYDLIPYIVQVSGGRFQYTVTWVNDTATPYRMKLTNNSDYLEYISGLVITY